MFVDKELLLSSEQDLNGVSATTVVSTNAINTSVARDIAKGEPLYVVIVCDKDVAGATTVQFKLISDTDNTLVAAAKVLGDTGALAYTLLTKGRLPIVFPLPPMMSGINQQYIGVSYTVAGSCSAGKFTAFLAVGPHTNF